MKRRKEKKKKSNKENCMMGEGGMKIIFKFSILKGIKLTKNNPFSSKNKTTSFHFTQQLQQQQNKKLQNCVIKH